MSAPNHDSDSADPASDVRPASPTRALLSAHWENIEATLSVLAEPGSTVRPAGSRSSTTRLPLPDPAAREERLTLHDVLGMGGMGVVRRGVQAVLDREVAVKAVRPDKRSEQATVSLLQEAYVSGALEHPNIVPVYDIGADDRGEPLIVQQKIGGTPWSELIADAAAVEERFGADDHLEWNLRVLMSVCDAVRYAHSRGVLHLDIKPSNVMIGAFGEVFLLDWGLAMALEDDGSGRIPLARDNEDVIGTPAYIAPEMVSQGDLPLTERTDVYLLGATLYHVCGGEPPHQGPTALASLYAAIMGTRSPPDGVPAELGAICMKAMSYEAEERYASATDLRLALQRFLLHRGAIELADDARIEHERLRELWAEDDDDSGRVEARFSAARFGFEHALAVWPEAPGVRPALRGLRVGMARWHLDHERPQAAKSLLAETEDPPTDLMEAVEARLAELDALGNRVDKLQAYRDQQDWRVAVAARAAVLVVVSAGFAFVPIRRAIWGPPPGMDWTPTVTEPLSFLAFFGLLTVVFRRQMASSAVNRRTVATGFTLFLGQTLLTLVAQRIGLGINAFLPILMGFWATVAMLFAVHVDRRLMPSSLAYVAGTAGVLTWPEHQWWIMTASALSLMANVAVIWVPRARTR